MPYHTEGSIMLYTEADSGTLLAGDSAVAPGPQQESMPERLERPPVVEGASDDEQRCFWRNWNRPLRSVLPLHGVPYTDRRDLAGIMRPLAHGEPMRNE